ncbi:MAG: hypothetical protein ABIH83_03600 [Candidatus Micrarchaeota archaeon]
MKKASEKKKKSALTLQQKYALIAGAAIIVIILGFTLFFGGGEDDAQTFTDYLYNSPGNGIIMDIRNSPSQEVSSNIMQCGVNLISGGFFAQTKKDLLVYACDDSGCISSSAINATDTNITDEEIPVVQYDEALYDMRGKAYFLIKYGQYGKFSFHPNYLEVHMNSSSDPSVCAINLKRE